MIVSNGRSMCLTAEVGDYCEEFAEQEYLSSMKLLPNQTQPIEMQIMQHHKEHMYVLLILSDNSILN